MSCVVESGCSSSVRSNKIFSRYSILGFASILQQIEGNLIYPRVVGSSVGLPSIWVLAAVSIGASLMGIVGMLVFIPIVSVLYALLRGDVYEHLEKKGIAVDQIGRAHV